MTDERRPRNRKYRLIIGALVAVAVVSGGAAYAATQDDSPQARSQAIVDDAAGTLGVDPAKLSDALKQALQKQVDAQVTAGKLTQEQADAIKKRIADGTQPIFGGGPGGLRRPSAPAARQHFGHHGASARSSAAPASRPASRSSRPTSAWSPPSCAPSCSPASRSPTSPRRRARRSTASRQRSPTR